MATTHTSKPLTVRETALLVSFTASLGVAVAALTMAFSPVPAADTTAPATGPIEAAVTRCHQTYGEEKALEKCLYSAYMLGSEAVRAENAMGK